MARAATVGVSPGASGGPSASSSPGLQRVQRILERLQDRKDHFFRDAETRIRAVSAERRGEHAGSSVFEWTLTDRDMNLNGTVHGGAIASAIDLCTSIALAAVPSQSKHFKQLGVSANLSIAYTGTAVTGDRLLLRCDVEKLGRNLTTITCSVVTQNGAPVASGTHTKFNTDSRL